MITCPKCRWFLGNIRYWMNEDADIIKVLGICKRHGEVEPIDWAYEDLVGWA